MALIWLLGYGPLHRVHEDFEATVQICQTEARFETLFKDPSVLSYISYVPRIVPGRMCRVDPEVLRNSQKTLLLQRCSKATNKADGAKIRYHKKKQTTTLSPQSGFLALFCHLLFH